MTSWNPYSLPVLSAVLIVLLLSLPLSLIGQQAGTADVLLNRVTIGAGAVAAAGSAGMRGTIGQPLIGRAQAGSAVAALGFWPAFSRMPVGVENPSPALANTLELAAYPNPFTRQAALDLVIDEESVVRALVYDVSGRPVACICENLRLQAGRSSLAWNGRDAAGRSCSPGVYFIRIEALSLRGSDARTAVQPLLLMR